jgi:pantothenate kinase
VKDIYGSDAPFKGLEGDILASSFGRVATDNQFSSTGEGKTNFRSIEESGYKREDIAKSLVFMIAFNIGQMGHLCAKIHDVNK